MSFSEGDLVKDHTFFPFFSSEPFPKICFHRKFGAGLLNLSKTEDLSREERNHVLQTFFV